MLSAHACAASNASARPFSGHARVFSPSLELPDPLASASVEGTRAMNQPHLLILINQILIQYHHHLSHHILRLTSHRHWRPPPFTLNKLKICPASLPGHRRLPTCNMASMKISVAKIYSNASPMVTQQIMK
jgi:hypothetical protein